MKYYKHQEYLSALILVLYLLYRLLMTLLNIIVKYLFYAVDLKILTENMVVSKQMPLNVKSSKILSSTALYYMYNLLL